VGLRQRLVAIVGLTVLVSAGAGCGETHTSGGDSGMASCCNVGNADSICGSYTICWCTVGPCAPGSGEWASCAAASNSFSTDASSCSWSGVDDYMEGGQCECNSGLPPWRGLRDSGSDPCGYGHPAHPAIVVPRCPPP